MNRPPPLAPLTLLTLFVLLSVAPRASAAELHERCARLRIGDTEERILQTIDGAPQRRTHSNLAGVERSELVFSAGATTCTVTLLFGRLVARTVEQRPGSRRPGWLPF